MDIKGSWKSIVTQNRTALRSYFCDDAVIRWHCTNEQFTVEEYIQVNCDYPGKWQGEFERLEENDSTIVLVGKVQSENGTSSCHIISFIELQDNKVIEMDEYWSDDGEAPSWRRELRIGKPVI